MPRPAGRAAHRLLAHPQRYSTRPSVRPHHSISSALATRPGPAHPSRGRLRRQPRCCQRIADGSAAERFWHAAAHRLVPRPSWPRPRGRPPPRDSPSGRRHLTAQASQPALIQTRARTFAMGGYVIGHGNVRFYAVAHAIYHSDRVARTVAHTPTESCDSAYSMASDVASLLRRCWIGS
jgi:hypothetical protein